MHSPPPDVLAHPSVERLKRVAIAIGDLVEEVVFIGGAVSPLLQETPALDQARVTQDVDGIIATTTYTEMSGVGARLEARGFNRSATGKHVHQWISPDSDVLDLVPSGQHLGASGQHWDEYATRDNLVAALGDAVTIRHASSAAFLALKWAAFRDRGAGDPGSSHDLEDIAAVVISRPRIFGEVQEASDRVRGFVAEQTRIFLLDERAEDYLAGCFNRAQDPLYTLRLAMERLREIETL